MDGKVWEANDYSVKQLDAIPALMASDTFSSEESCSPRSLESPKLSSMVSPSDVHLETLQEMDQLDTSNVSERSSKEYGHFDEPEVVGRISRMDSENRRAIFRDGAIRCQGEMSQQTASMRPVLGVPCAADVEMGGEVPPQSFAGFVNPHDSIMLEESRVRPVDSRSTSSPIAISSAAELNALVGRLSAHLNYDDDDEFLNDLLNAADDADRQEILDIIGNFEKKIESERYRVSFTPAADYNRRRAKETVTVPYPRRGKIDSESIYAGHHDEELGYHPDEEAGYGGNQYNFDEPFEPTDQRIKENESVIEHYSDVHVRFASTRVSFIDMILAATIILLVVLAWTGRSNRVLSTIQAATNQWLDHSLGYADLEAAVLHSRSKDGVSHISTFLNVKLNFIGVWLGI
jgi:hypothetical protein